MTEAIAGARRVAGVDIGSNAIRFLAVELGVDGARSTLAYGRAPVRLGSALRTGLIPDEAIAAAGEAFGSFRAALDRLASEGRPVERVRAVATSAVRESRNGGAVIEIGRRVAGFDIEVIGGDEEAWLVWRAVREAVSLEGGAVLVDLGGGSLEVSLVGPSAIEWTKSYPVGTVRLLDSPAEAGAVLGDVRVPRLGHGGPAALIATGGNIEALARLAGVEPEGGAARGETSRLPVAALVDANARVAALKPKKRVKKLGLRKDRADVIEPAGRVYARIAELAGAAEIVVPHVGVLDGIVAELGARSREGGEGAKGA